MLLAPGEIVVIARLQDEGQTATYDGVDVPRIRARFDECARDLGVWMEVRPISARISYANSKARKEEGAGRAADPGGLYGRARGFAATRGRR